MNTEERIISAFKEMARSQGFNAVRMEELAARAGITKKTIYSYFASKKDLIEKVVNTFITDIGFEVENIMSKTNLIETISSTAESVLKEGAFLFNAQSLRDLQIYYPDIWQQFLKFRTQTIGSIVDVIYTRTKKKWVLEINQRLLKEALIAIDNRFSSPEFAAEMGMPVEELTLQMAKILIYPYL